MLKKDYGLRFLSAVLTLVLALSCIAVTPVAAEETVITANEVEADLSVAKLNKYNSYSLKNADAVHPQKTITITAQDNFIATSDANATVGEYAGKQNVVVWNSDSGELSWSFNVPESGNYCVRVTYFSFNDNAVDVQIGLKLDGQTPFFEAGQITLPKCFRSEGDIVQDTLNNDVRPKQVSYEDWITADVTDNTGLTTAPYDFYLSQGSHTITLTGALAKIAIERIEFYNLSEPPSYSEYVGGSAAVNTEYTKVYEAEKPLYVSSSMIYPVYDRTSVDTSPSDPVKLRYNTIGGSNFASQGQYIVWNVEAPQDGYYYLGARIRQNINTGTVSYRRLYVNDVVPFKEAESVKFNFSNKWQEYVFGENEPWLFKLKKGENKIKLEVITGDMSNILYDLQELVGEVNTLYREIIMITGASPDTYRDYHIDSEIKDFNDRVSRFSKKAQEIFDSAIKLGNNGSGNFSAVTKLKMLLDDFLKSPNQITSKISTLNSYCSGVSSLILTVKSQPLELDTITISTDIDGLKTKKAGFWGNIIFQAKAFVGSFVEDYNSFSSTNEGAEKQIDVWINLGRDQATVLKSLSDSMFTPKYNISANISLVQQSLVQATLSGMSPDVVLFVANGEPVNLAMRGGLKGLSEFDTFDEVVSRFNKHSMDSYYYNGDYYAIPIAETFPMMFYRTDILESLGIEPPNTWNEFYKVIRVLQHSNLTAGIPNADSSNVMAVDTSIYSTLLYQSEEKLYDDDFKTTNLDSDTGIEIFNIWTEFYKDYGLPYQYDFFNRFRSGDMPIGLSSYALYGKLKQAAPEIEGLWEMALIPGTVDQNGNINRSVCASGSCAVIMNASDSHEEAWKFIDWFSDTEAQSAYGQEMEALLGPSGRHTPANIEALSNLPWTYQEQQLIKEQWKESFMLPQIPGSYILDRNLINAFRKVVFNSANARETIVSYNKTIEYEIERKRKEFNLD